MAFKDLQAYLEDDTLTIPIGGKEYTIPSPDALTGLRFSAIADLGIKAAQGLELTDTDRDKIQFDDKEERDFVEQVLGTEAYETMLADEVSWVRIQRVSQYAFLYFSIGEQAADQAVASGRLNGSGKVPAPNRAQRRASTKGRTTATASTVSSRAKATI